MKKEPKTPNMSKRAAFALKAVGVKNLPISRPVGNALEVWVLFQPLDMIKLDRHIDEGIARDAVNFGGFGELPVEVSVGILERLSGRALLCFSATCRSAFYLVLSEMRRLAPKHISTGLITLGGSRMHMWLLMRRCFTMGLYSSGFVSICKVCRGRLTREVRGDSLRVGCTNCRVGICIAPYPVCSSGCPRGVTLEIPTSCVGCGVSLCTYCPREQCDCETRPKTWCRACALSGVIDCADCRAQESREREVCVLDVAGMEDLVPGDPDHPWRVGVEKRMLEQEEEEARVKGARLEHSLRLHTPSSTPVLNNRAPITTDPKALAKLNKVKRARRLRAEERDAFGNVGDNDL